MALLDRLSADLKEAIRLGQPVRRDALRLLLAELKKERDEHLRLALEDQERARGRPLTDEEARAFASEHGETLSDSDAEAVLRRQVKRHQQSIDAFERGNREDLVAHERAQLDAIRAYLPTRMGSDEIADRARVAIEETGARTRKDMGKVMGRLASLRDRADMGEVSKVVQSLLAP